ncbi:MAG: hypothetical protein Kow0027_06080 [Saprospiraceae bacterium]
MVKQHLLFRIRLGIIGVLLFSGVGLLAQRSHQWAGEWKGSIEIPGAPLELSIELKQNDSVWTGSLDIPVQFIKGMNLDDLRIWQDSISFRLNKVPGNASFSGIIAEGEAKISGIFKQSGFSFPMRLQKQNPADDIAEEKRLQRAVETLRQLADSLMEKEGVPGLGWGIVKDGKVLLQEGFGYADPINEIPATADTRFAIGSCTKAFTATCLAMLAAEGRLDWEEPIINYLPDFRLYDDFATQEMTAADLLTHRSGLPRHDLVWYGANLSRKELYQRLRYLRPSRSFRAKFQYQNLMYMTAGMLVEKLSGQSWEDFVRQRIFQPLGMEQSNLSVTEMEEDERNALACRRNADGQLFKMSYRNIDAIGPAGSINSSVSDMLKWVQFHLDLGSWQGTELLPADEVLNQHRPHMIVTGPMQSILSGPGISNINYGFGWFTYVYRGKTIVQHGGNIDGFSAMVFLVPEERLGMVLLTNLNGNSLPTVLAHSATDILLGMEPFDWYGAAVAKRVKSNLRTDKARNRISGTRPQHPLTEYTGTYHNDGYGDMVVALQDSGLTVTYNEFRARLEHWHYESFKAADPTIDQENFLTFYTGRDGRVESFTTMMEPMVPDIAFKRVPPAYLSTAGYQQTLIGKYELAGMEIRIFRNGQLLQASLPGQPVYTLLPYDDDEYQLKGLNGYRMKFLKSQDGQVEALKITQPEGVFLAKRKKE